MPLLVETRPGEDPGVVDDELVPPAGPGLLDADAHELRWAGALPWSRVGGAEVETVFPRGEVAQPAKHRAPRPRRERVEGRPSHGGWAHGDRMPQAPTVRQAPHAPWLTSPSAPTTGLGRPPPWHAVRMARPAARRETSRGVLGSAAARTEVDRVPRPPQGQLVHHGETGFAGHPVEVWEGVSPDGHAAATVPDLPQRGPGPGGGERARRRAARRPPCGSAGRPAGPRSRTRPTPPPGRRRRPRRGPPIPAAPRRPVRGRRPHAHGRGPPWLRPGRSRSRGCPDWPGGRTRVHCRSRRRAPSGPRSTLPSRPRIAAGRTGRRVRASSRRVHSCRRPRTGRLAVGSTTRIRQATWPQASLP